MVRDYFDSKQRDKQYKQKTSPKSYKTEIKIVANPGLAKSAFEQPGPEMLGHLPMRPDILILCADPMGTSGDEIVAIRVL